MATQKSITQFRGRVGNMVGYRVTNAAKPGTNGLRVHVDTINNPRTRAQAIQRMRIAPAVNFYRGLADVLDHSWQGVKYGARSRSFFMKVVLAKGHFNPPYVPKNTKAFIPGEFPVSIGSLPSNLVIESVQKSESGEGVNYRAHLNAQLFPHYDDTATWGEFSRAAISINPIFKDGDQITFLSVYEVSEGVFIPIVKYVVLDTTSLAVTETYMFGAGLRLQGNYIMNVKLVGRNDWVAFTSAPMVACAFIISRHPSRSSRAWLRSSSVLYCTPEFKARYMSQQAFEDAVASYMSGETVMTSDWLLNQSAGSNGAAALNPATTYEVMESEIAFGGLTKPMAQLSVDGANIKPIVYWKGSTPYYTRYYPNRLIIEADYEYQLAERPTPGTYYDFNDVKAVLPEFMFEVGSEIQA